MTVLITGGAGFIGSHLADKLLSAGHKIIVVDDYRSSAKNNLKSHEALLSIHGSVTDESLINEIFKTHLPEVVIHAAASYKDPFDWKEDVETNVLGTINLVKASQQNGIKRFIYFQTSLCYGLKPIEHPITLEHPLLYGDPFGVSSYAISKTAAEQYIQNSCLNFISFRLANVYGPRNITGPVPAFYYKLKAGELCTVVDTKRDFIYIDDVVNCVLKVITKPEIRGFYHISTGKDHAIKELYDLMAHYLKADVKDKVKLVPKGEDDASTILIDPSKTKKDLDWEPITTLDQGIKKSIDWYGENKITQTFTHLKNLNN